MRRPREVVDVDWLRRAAEAFIVPTVTDRS